MTVSLSALTVLGAMAAGQAADPQAGLGLMPDGGTVGVVPVLIGPLQALLAFLPAILAAIGGMFVTLFKWSTIKKLPRIIWAVRTGFSMFAIMLVVLIVEAFNWRALLGVAVGLTLYVQVWARVKKAAPVRWLRHLDWPVGCGALLGVFLGVMQVFAPNGAPAANVKTEDEAVPWSLYRGSIERRGAVPESAEPVAGGVNWGFSSECRIFYSSPCVVGNRVYIASSDKGPMRDVGAIYCLDADTGMLIWKSRPRRYLATFSSPSVACKEVAGKPVAKYLVVGEGLHFTTTARVVCMDVERNGKVLWTFRTKSHVESSPVIDLKRERVYIGAGDDGYYCLSLTQTESGRDGPSPKVLWHCEGENYKDCETSPVELDGKVYFGLGMYGNALVCVDAMTGKEDWRIVTPYPEFGSPTIMDGKLYFGMGNGNFIETAEQVAIKEIDRLKARLKTAGKGEAEIAAEVAKAKEELKAGGTVWCVDLAKAAASPTKKNAADAVDWRHDVPRIVLSAVAARKSPNGEGRLYFGCQDGKLYCISTDKGERQGTWDSRSGILASPALGQEHVYVVTKDGRLVGLDSRTLEPVWETQVGLVGMFISSPALARGHIYVGSDNDGVLCLGVPEFQDPIWPGRLGGTGASGWFDGSPVAEAASFGWRWPESEETPDTPPVRTPVAPLGEAIYVGLQDFFTGPAPGKVGLARVDLVEKPGNPTPKAENAWFVPTALPVFDTAALGNSIFFVTGEPGRSGRMLTSVVAGDAWEGTRGEWEAKVDAAAKALGIRDDRAKVMQKLIDGGAFRPGEQTVTFYLRRAAAVLTRLAGRPEQVKMTDLGFDPTPAGGTQRWQCPIAEGASGRLLVTQRRQVEDDARPPRVTLQQELFVVDGENRLTCISLRGKDAGRNKWTAPVNGAIVGAPVLGEDEVVVVVRSGPTGALVARDLRTGAEQWAAALDAAPTTGPIYNQGLICVGSDRGVTAYSVVGGTRLWNAPVGAVLGELVGDARRLAATTPAGQLLLLDWVNGKVLATVSGVLPDVPPMLCRDWMLFCDAQSIQRYEFNSKNQSRWLLTNWMGRVTAPMVQLKSHVYVPTAKRGLVCVRPKR